MWLSSFCPLAHRCSLALESTWDMSPGSNHFPGMLFRRLTGSRSRKRGGRVVSLAIGFPSKWLWTAWDIWPRLRQWWEKAWSPWRFDWKRHSIEEVIRGYPNHNICIYICVCVIQNSLNKSDHALCLWAACIAFCMHACSSTQSPRFGGLKYYCVQFGRQPARLQ